MITWRAVGVGVVAFPVLVVATALSEPFALLVVGAVPGGVAAALAPRGLRNGAAHGSLVGATVTLGAWLSLYAWVTLAPPEQVAPGFGLSLAVLALFGLVAGVESVVAGTVVGLVR